MTRQRLYTTFFEPHSQHADSRRREYIVNVILAGLTCISIVALLSSVEQALQANNSATTNSVIINLFSVGLFAGLWRAARRGHYKISSYLVVGLLALATTQLTLQWSFELPIAELLYALTIVVAGMLLTTRAALWTTGAISLLLLTISYEQVAHNLHPNMRWIHQTIEIGDAIGYVAIFAIIALVSWLANREVDKSLDRALRSEADLAHERDNLEIKVVERTQELEQMQQVRIMELRRFAEFGRLSANLLHEIANPLTAATLNLEQVKQADQSASLIRASSNLKHLERYVLAAREQLAGTVRIGRFSVRSEVQKILRLQTPQAEKAGLHILYKQANNYMLTGDPVKFGQIVSNLLSNAIEASVGLQTTKNDITISVTREQKILICNVHDRGRGVSAGEIKRIFEPFYTTKRGSNNNMGIGLAMVQSFVEEDFDGHIAITSSKAAGTTITVRLNDKQLS